MSAPHILDAGSNWPHQARGRDAAGKFRAAGTRTLVSVAPPGGGKSRMMFQDAADEVLTGGSVTIAVHRNLLLEQMRIQLIEAGIPFGLIAPDVELDLDKPVQLASIHTLYSRAVKAGSIDLPRASLVLLDEAHANRSEMARALIFGAVGGGLSFDGWLDQGAFVHGFTGTPVNLGGLYDQINQFTSYKELRDCNAHAMIRTYGPEEIDVADLKTDDDGEYSGRALESRSYKIWGSVYEWWQRLNPFAEPALLFGPSAPGARWFAHEFVKRGVTAGYIGSDCVLLPGHLPCGTLCLDQYPSTTDTRTQALQLSESGGLKVLCNRFVLREAIDMPWIRHGIAATVFGGLATYLQSVGRIQRYFAAYPDKIWQCHGGSFWRHGSPNAERYWELGCTNKSLAKLRKAATERAENAQDVEGIQCPKCRGWRSRGPACPHCGHMHKRSVRFVRQVDGALVELTGAVHRTAKKKKKVTAQSLWNGVLFGSFKADRPVSSAVSIFYARCKGEKLASVNIQELHNAPPDRESRAYHQSVRVVYPHLKPKGFTT